MTQSRVTRCMTVLVLGLILPMGTLAVGGAEARPIPCSAFPANFFVYGGYGTFTFGNQKAYDGFQYTFNWKCGQTFTVKAGQLSAGWKFAQWYSSSGAFTDPTATSTSFSPDGGPVNIEMVLNRTTNSNAAGYVLQRRANAPGTITEAFASFYLPTSVAMHEGDTTEELLSVWAGLGGVNGPSASDYPWAGGIDLVECGANYPVGSECSGAGFYLRWFYSYATGKVTTAFQSGVDNAGFLGDWITVDIHYSTTNGTGWLYMKDQSRSGISFSKVCTPSTCFGSGSGSPPTLDSADFVVTGGREGPVTLIAPSPPNLLIPSFDSLRFTGFTVLAVASGTTYGYDTTTDNAVWWHQQSVTLAGAIVSQSLFPSALAKNVQFTFAGPAVRLPGIVNGGAPPDVQLAVGPHHILEMVNAHVNIWNRAGVLVASADILSFFTTKPGDYVSDPKVLFDAPSGRWFATIIDIPQRVVLLRVSQSSDPTLGWYQYAISGTFSGISYLQDQPILGVSGDKVAVSMNDFYLCNPSPCGLAGVQLWIGSKSDAIAGLNPHNYSSGPASNPSWRSVHPVQTLSSYLYGPTNTLYMVSSWVPTLFTVTGTPPSVTISTQSIFFANYATPPSAPQLGSSNLLDTGDARIQDAFWQGGYLWLTFSDSCIPSGDTNSRACFRLTEINVDSFAGPTVTRDFDTGVAQKYLLYPSVRPDNFGNLFLVFGYSSSTDYPGIMTSYFASNAPAGAGLQPPAIRVLGATYIHCPVSVCRYGDYFGTALDPVNLNAVWMAAEYGGSDYGATYVLQS